MALYKRNKIYWIDINHSGQRIQRSTGTSDRLAAEEFHDNVKVQLWRQSKLGVKPEKTWMDAVVRWLDESSYKKSLKTDKFHLRWLDPYLKNERLKDINREMIEKLAKIKSETGVSDARVNRMLALIRAILNRAADDWDWIDSAPKVRLRKEDNHRIRWLNRDEAKRLIAELPQHLADMAIFTLATGLRQSNVRDLKWRDVDVESRHAWVHADEAKGAKAIAVPLNADALAVLQRCRGKHTEYVFTFRGNSIFNVSTRAWRKALVRAGIENFRWHDLRHTWASWHVQNGTSLQELQMLGGWSNFSMVLRYAHLSSAHLQAAAERVYVTNSLHGGKEKESSLASHSLSA